MCSLASSCCSDSLTRGWVQTGYPCGGGMDTRVLAWKLTIVASKGENKSHRWNGSANCWCCPQGLSGRCGCRKCPQPFRRLKPCLVEGVDTGQTRHGLQVLRVPGVLPVQVCGPVARRGGCSSHPCVVSHSRMRGGRLRWRSHSRASAGNMRCMIFQCLAAQQGSV